MSDKAEPWYQPPTIYYRGEERFGTPEQMIDEITSLREELDRHNTWQGIMQLVEKHYPAAVFDGSSVNPGARLVVALREITRLRERCEALEALVRRASTDSTTSLGGPGCFYCDRDDTDRFKNHAADCPVRKVLKEPNHAD